MTDMDYLSRYWHSTRVANMIVNSFRIRPPPSLIRVHKDMLTINDN